MPPPVCVSELSEERCSPFHTNSESFLASQSFAVYLLLFLWLGILNLEHTYSHPLLLFVFYNHVMFP